MDGTSKTVEFRGSSLADLCRFPEAARREAGFQLFQVQEGRDPDDWKPMSSIGTGVREKSGAFRVLYIAQFAEAIYVLHCFQKKTQKTSAADIGLGTKRYQELMQELRP